MPARCSAHRTDGTPCKRYPLRGARVCATHGGRAPAVRAKAAVRLLEASDVAAAYLVKTIKDERLPADIRLRAATDLLNRAGLSGKERIEVEVTPKALEPWQELFLQPGFLTDGDGRPAIPDGNATDVQILYSSPGAASEPVVDAEVVPATTTGLAVQAPTPTSDSEAAHAAYIASKGVADPMPPGAVQRVDGPRPRVRRRT